MAKGWHAGVDATCGTELNMKTRRTFLVAAVASLLALAIMPLQAASPSWRTRGLKGNPKGRKAAGKSIIEHMNAMAGMTPTLVQTIAEDRYEAANKRVAAKVWLKAIKNPSSRR